jgi:hypothetical protein
LEPAWVRFIRGAQIVYGPALAVGGTSTVAVSTTFADSVTFGPGEPNATTFTGLYKSAIGWLDASTGDLVRGALVAENSAPSVHAGVYAEYGGMGVAADGSVYHAGAWYGSARFHPGTPAAVTLTAQQRLVGSDLHRAEDPFVTRYDPNGVPGWVTRGRTPGLLTETWFNHIVDLTVLPAGGVAVVGRYEFPGFIVGDGTAGAVTMGGTGQLLSYFATIDEAGVPTWVSRNSAPTGELQLEAAPDGSLYATMVVAPGATILEDGPAPVTITPGQRFATFAVVKIDTNHQVAWVRRIALENQARDSDMAVDANGGVKLVMTCRGVLDVLGPTDSAVATHDCTTGEVLALSWSASGDLDWMTPFGASLSRSGHVTTGANGVTWVLAHADVGISSVALDGAPDVPVPAPPSGATGSITLLYRLSPAGRRERALVLGQNLTVRELVSHGGALFTVGTVSAPTDQVRLAGPNANYVDVAMAEAGANSFAYVLKYVP